KCALDTTVASIQKLSIRVRRTGPSPSAGYPSRLLVPIRNSPPGRRTIPSVEPRLALTAIGDEAGLRLVGSRRAEAQQLGGFEESSVESATDANVRVAASHCQSHCLPKHGLALIPSLGAQSHCLEETMRIMV